MNKMSSSVHFLVFKTAPTLPCRVILGALVRRLSPACATNLQVHPQVGLPCNSWEEIWVHMVFQALFIVRPVSSMQDLALFSISLSWLSFVIITSSCEQLCGHCMEMLLIMVEFFLLPFHNISLPQLASCRSNFCVLLTHVLALRVRVTAKMKP